jgi:hypothetical protein
VLRDLSIGGAMITSISRPGQIVAAHSSSVDLEVLEGEFAGLRLRVRPVRMQADADGVTIGVHFSDLDTQTRERIRTIIKGE